MLLRRDDDPDSVFWTHRLELRGTDDGGDKGIFAFYFEVDRSATVPLWEREPPYLATKYRVAAGPPVIPG